MVLQIAQIQKSKSLTNDLADTLRAQILKGDWDAGTKLPASKDIEKAAGVSRTVVREAVAILKAEGLIESRQGVGVFVSARKKNKLFSIDQEEFNSFEDAIQILELRMAVEIEMASMAATNRSQAQMDEINAALKVVNTKMAKRVDGRNEDFEFHLSIAKASGNSYFTRFIEFIGSGVIPARELILNHSVMDDKESFFDTICAEHASICEAIQNQDALGAKNAMAKHLGNSKKRHIKIVEQLSQHA
jgi:DNA-binding FadR family transcriptional regulator